MSANLEGRTDLQVFEGCEAHRIKDLDQGDSHTKQLCGSPHIQSPDNVDD